MSDIVEPSMNLVFGVGINDADYIVNPSKNGVQKKCPYYSRWTSILERCYCKKLQTKQPSYIGCTVCEEWLSFSNFKAWMKTQDWQGKHLDKDIIFPNNKVYSPETCRFISGELNLILGRMPNTGSGLPTGVYEYKESGRFQALYRYNRKRFSLGCFDTAEEASKAYRKAKSGVLIKESEKQSDPMIKSGLLLHAEIIGSERNVQFT